MMKKLVYAIIAWLLLQPSLVLARQSVNGWYIKDFKTNIQLNKDSSATITEYITADCGQSRGKHGIYRIVPTKVGRDDQAVKTPVELISITDQNGQAYKYQTTKDSINQTVTWKIGDPHKEVKGENHYQIKYRVSNVIRQQDNFDEFYWNILGAFWDMDIDNFSAWIIFPPEIKADSVVIDYYTGQVGQKNKDLANYRWLNNILVFESTKTIPKNNGITISLSFAQNIFIPDESAELVGKTTIVEKIISKYLAFFAIANLLLLSFLALIAGLIIYLKHGRNPKDKRPVIAEYGPPDNLDPLAVGTIWQDRLLVNKFMTALIISLAVKGVIKIKEEIKDHIFYKLTDNPKAENSLSNSEKTLLNELFKDGTTVVKKSELSSNFYTKVFNLHHQAVNELKENGYFEKATFKWRNILLIAAIVLMAVSPIAGIILFVFYAITSHKKTPKGMDALLKIKGLKLYMETAEKHRQQFYEQENIFDQLLPYAIIFGLTKQWVKKMADIYGPEKIETTVATWYVGGNFHLADINDLADSLNNSITQISQSIHNLSGSNWSSGGSYGSGSSGGGGGGGGGGGW